MGAYTCQHGTVHKMCRCPEPHTINCPTPVECQKTDTVDIKAALHVDAGDLKMLRETLCQAQSALHHYPYPTTGSIEGHTRRIGVLIEQIDQHRPLGPDCKHGNRHTPTCGCEDK